VENICVYGDSLHSYLIAIIVPNFKLLPNDQNLDHRSLCEQPEAIRQVSEQLQEFGRRSGLHRTEIPTKVHLVAEEWVPDSGLVTAALKLRRKNIQDFYAKAIHKLYGIESSKSK
jgi:long-chain acyl-CoA synthetase